MKFHESTIIKGRTVWLVGGSCEYGHDDSERKCVFQRETCLRDSTDKSTWLCTSSDPAEDEGQFVDDTVYLTLRLEGKL